MFRKKVPLYYNLSIQLLTQFSLTPLQNIPLIILQIVVKLFVYKIFFFVYRTSHCSKDLTKLLLRNPLTGGLN